MPVRAFTQRQFPALLEFVENLRSWDSQGRDLRRRTFEETLNQPGLVPENDCFLLEENGRIQGFCLVVPELPIGRAVLELEIGPQLEGGPSEKEVVLQALDRQRLLLGCLCGRRPVLALLAGNCILALGFGRDAASDAI